MVFETRTTIIASNMHSNFHFIQEKSDARGLHLGLASCSGLYTMHSHRPGADFAFLLSMLLFMLPILVNVKSVKINSDIKVVREMFS